MPFLRDVLIGMPPMISTQYGREASADAVDGPSERATGRRWWHHISPMMLMARIRLRAIERAASS